MDEKNIIIYVILIIGGACMQLYYTDKGICNVYTISITPKPVLSPMQNQAVKYGNVHIQPIAFFHE